MGRIWTRPRTPVAAQLLWTGGKPVGALKPRYSHSLCPNRAWLLNEGGEVIRDLIELPGHAGGSVAQPFSSTVTRTRSGLQKTGTVADGVQIDFKKPTAYGDATQPFTLVTRVKIASTSTSSRYIATQVSGFMLSYTSSIRLDVWGVTTELFPFSTAIWMTVAQRWNPNTGQDGFLDGVLMTTGSDTSESASAANTNPFTLFYRDGVLGSDTVDMEYCYIYDRALTDAQIRRISQRPYQWTRAANGAPFRYPEAIPPATGEDNAILMGSNF